MTKRSHPGGHCGQCSGKGSGPGPGGRESRVAPAQPFGKGFWIQLLLLLAIVIGAVAYLRKGREANPSAGDTLGPSFEYDLTRFSKTDPKLIIADEGESIALGDEPTCMIRHSDGTLLVGFPNEIRVLSADGSAVVRSVRIDGDPGSVAEAEDGDLLVAVRDHVIRIAADGATAAVWPSLGTNAVLTSIAVIGEDVFVADAGNRIVHRFDLDGAANGTIGKKDPGGDEPGFVIPSPYFDIAAEGDDALWVVDPGGTSSFDTEQTAAEHLHGNNRVWV